MSKQVNLNRAGVPLLEIVSEPDMRTGLEDAEYASEIQRLVRFLSGKLVRPREGYFQSPRPIWSTSSRPPAPN
ncbi:hypothetical protein ACHQM5_024327 [Ranunculus cassubicifolius]